MYVNLENFALQSVLFIDFNWSEKELDMDEKLTWTYS